MCNYLPTKLDFLTRLWLSAVLILLCSPLYTPRNAVAQSLQRNRKLAAPSVDFRRGDLKVSANKRFLVHADDMPFFYLVDTAW